jgi:hypothetical protein
MRYRIQAYPSSIVQLRSDRVLSYRLTASDRSHDGKFVFAVSLNALPICFSDCWDYACSSWRRMRVGLRALMRLHSESCSTISRNPIRNDERACARFRRAATRPIAVPVLEHDLAWKYLIRRT